MKTSLLSFFLKLCPYLILSHPIINTESIVLGRRVCLQRIVCHHRHSVTHTIICALTVKRSIFGDVLVMDCCWWRQHHGSHRLFSWPQLQHSSDRVDQSSYWLQGKLGQIEQANLKEECEAFWQFYEAPISPFFAVFRHYDFGSWIVFWGAVEEPAVELCLKLFWEVKAASARRALMCSVWQLRFVLQLKSGSEPQWT